MQPQLTTLPSPRLHHVLLLFTTLPLISTLCRDTAEIERWLMIKRFSEEQCAP